MKLSLKQESLNNYCDDINYCNLLMCKYVLVGKAASGKDYCQNLFIKKGYTALKQYTTRPKRPNEKGDEYIFVSEKKIQKLIDEKKFISLKNFNNWYYGFTLEDFKKCDVAILSVGNIQDLEKLDQNILKCVTIIYLDIPIEIRKKRLKERYNGGKKDDSLKRRVEADEFDFLNYRTYDIRFLNNNDAVNFINKITPILKNHKKSTKHTK